MTGRKEEIRGILWIYQMLARLVSEVLKANIESADKSANSNGKSADKSANNGHGDIVDRT